MKIKITRAHESKWYHNRIGKVYVVRAIWDIPGVLDKRFVIRNYRTILRTIDYNDAKIVEK